MDTDKDSQPDQTKSIGIKLPRKRLTQNKEYLRAVKKITKNAADKGLTNRRQTIELVKLMLRVEDSASKFKLLKILVNTSHVDYLKLFLNNHGLKILYLWMVKCKEADFYLKIAILKILAALPISSKTALKTAKVWDLVEKWSNLINGIEEDDDIQEVCVSNSDEDNDKNYRLSNKACISARSSAGITDSPEIVELEENCDQRKTNRTKGINRNEISNNCEKNIKSITIDSDCDEITEIGSQVQTKCYDQSGTISEHFVQDIIMKMSIILREKKVSLSSNQSEKKLESSQNNTIDCDKKSSIEPSRESISSNFLYDYHELFNTLDTKIAENSSKSKDKSQNCINIESSSTRKNWTSADVSILASKLLEQWKDLKEVYKIPKIKATKPVETEKNDKKTETTKDSSKTSSNEIPNADINNDKKDDNQGNKEVNQQKSTSKSSHEPKKSTIYRRRQRVRQRNRRLEKFGNSFPQTDYRYQVGPQGYLGLCQQGNVNYEYYPNCFYLNQLPWQMTQLNYHY